MSFYKDGGKKDGHNFVVMEIWLAGDNDNDNYHSELVKCENCGMIGLRDLKDKNMIYIGEEFDTCDNHLVKDIIK